MSPVDGRDVFHRLRADVLTRNIPVVLVTSADALADGLPAEGFVSKPFLGAGCWPRYYGSSRRPDRFLVRLGLHEVPKSAVHQFGVGGVQRLRALQVSSLCDADKTLPVLDPQIRPAVRAARFVGAAFTVIAEDDHLAVLAAVGQAEPGQCWRSRPGAAPALSRASCSPARPDGGVWPGS